MPGVPWCMVDSPRMNARRRALWTAAGAGGVLLVLAAGYHAAPPLDAERLLQRGEEQLQTGDAPGAWDTFTRVTQRTPDDARGFDGVARALQMQPGFPRSDADAAAWLAAQESVLVRAQRERWPLASRAAVLRNHAFACFRLGQFARALPSLQELHASGGGSLETDLALAVTAQTCGFAAEARQVADAARVRYGDIEPAWKLEVALQSACGPWVMAEWIGLRNLAPLVKVTPAADPCREHLAAEQDLDGGRIDAAEAKWRSLLDGPAGALARLGLGRAALRRGAFAAALQHFDAAAATAAVPRETVHYWRAQVFARSGKYGPARAELQRASAANPLALRDGTLLGFVAAAAGDTAAAVNAYQSVLEVDRRHAEALYRLGSLWWSGPRRAEGRALLERCLEVQPTGARADEVRGLLQDG